MRDAIIILLAFAMVFALLGYMNRQDIQNCTEKGHSEAYCNHTFNR